ncbi:hypothetical protein Pan189_37040 [Stratiformator vulcanicus]|uniref:DUF1549 domain-containing protein n=2 Tax=Stratiformator vulcanicus TaxID=2527980 RepID=A0A517R5Y4_9PLAN|nr:hypothetical protein Pan189_37040 [Stratiformator vulcanicus]
MAIGLISCILLVSPAMTSADVAQLRTGGELRGLGVDGAAPDDSRVTLTTPGGITVELHRDDVSEVKTRSPLLEEYETKARTIPDTGPAHWELSEWCRENRLKDERLRHLRRLVEFEPDHERARAALGHIRHDGEWLPRDEAMRRRGYVKHDGRYVTSQERDLMERAAAREERVQAWYPRVRLWAGWLFGGHSGRQLEAIENFERIDDPDAIPALRRFLSNSKSVPVRELYVATIVNIGGGAAVGPLVDQSLLDVNRRMRDLALDSITENQFPLAMTQYRRTLRSDKNIMVRRSGIGLGRVADQNAVPDLIASLITTHQYKVQVPDRSGTMSFSTAGSFGAGGASLPPDIDLMLRSGQLQNGVIVNDPAAAQNVRWKTVTINYNHKNPEILTALKKITGAEESFGYDERTWLAWWTAQKNGTF